MSDSLEQNKLIFQTNNSRSSKHLTLKTSSKIKIQLKRFLSFHL